MFSWNKALAGGAVSTISNWVGDGLTAGLNHLVTTYAHYPMPDDVKGAFSTVFAGLLVALVVWAVPNAPAASKP